MTLPITDRREEGSRRESDDETELTTRHGGIRWQVVSWVLGMVVTVLMTYTAAQNATDTRLSVLERRQGDTDRRLERIEDKIDRLLSRP